MDACLSQGSTCQTTLKPSSIRRSSSTFGSSRRNSCAKRSLTTAQSTTLTQRITCPWPFRSSTRLRWRSKKSLGTKRGGKLHKAFKTWTRRSTPTPILRSWTKQRLTICRFHTISKGRTHNASCFKHQGFQMCRNQSGSRRSKGSRHFRIQISSKLFSRLETTTNEKNRN